MSKAFKTYLKQLEKESDSLRSQLRVLSRKIQRAIGYQDKITQYSRDSDEQVRLNLNNERVFGRLAEDNLDSLDLSPEEKRELLVQFEPNFVDPVYRKLIAIGTIIHFSDSHKEVPSLDKLVNIGAGHIILDGILYGMRQRAMNESEYTFLKNASESEIIEDFYYAVRKCYENQIRTLKLGKPLQEEFFWRREVFICPKS